MDSVDRMQKAPQGYGQRGGYCDNMGYGSSWIGLLIMFFVVWLIFWLVIYVSGMAWTINRSTGEFDAFTTGAVSLGLTLIVCIIIYGARSKW